MFELIDPHPPVNVQEAEYRRLLGYPKQHVPDGRARELADQARAWYAENGKPWIYARQTSGLELKNKRLRMHGTEFASKQLHDQFAAAQAHTAVLVAVSAGRECEETGAPALAGGQTGRIFFHGNVRLGGGRASGNGGQRPHLRLGRSKRHGSPAALQSGLFRLGHFRSNQTVEIDPAKTGPRFSRRHSGAGHRDVAAQEIAFGGVWHHAAFGQGAEPGDIGSLRKLLAAALPISPRAVSAFAAAN